MIYNLGHHLGLGVIGMYQMMKTQLLYADESGFSTAEKCGSRKADQK
jgi:hypothetical protein